MDKNTCPLVKSRQLEFDDKVESLLVDRLSLLRTELESFIPVSSSLNDGLNGDRPVTFKTNSGEYQIIHSQAKLKREYMTKYKDLFSPFEATETSSHKHGVASHKHGVASHKHGIVSRMNALRAEETLDATHSYNVRQFEFCVRVNAGNKRKQLEEFLSVLIPLILEALEMPSTYAIVDSSNFLKDVPKDPAEFEAARDAYELKLAKEYGCFAIVGIGPQGYDSRSPDYDDWSNNCDIFIYHKKLKRPIEICSMGYRVDAETLHKQLVLKHGEGYTPTDYQKKLLAGEYIQTLGGGIGIDRLRMLYFDLDTIGDANPNFA